MTEHSKAPPQSNYEFTTSWFQQSKRNWDALLPQMQVKTILEIGSYEGQSAVYLIEKLATQTRIELHCVDNWGGGIEHKAGGDFQADMNSVEQRFLHNTKIACERVGGNVDLFVHKGTSDIELSKLLSDSKENYFDFIYVDGSHQAPDVLCDAVLGFRLLKVGGVIVFDDYLWSEQLPYGVDPIRCPKTAIDAFTNIYIKKIRILSAPLYQLYVKKLSN